MKAPETAAEIDKIINQKYSTSFLNDTKWRKLLRVLCENHHLIKECQVKLIYDDQVRHLFIDGTEEENFDYYKSAMESMVSYTPRPGWTIYKEIEWLHFPAATEMGIQDLLSIQKVLQAVGQYQLEWDEMGLKIIGYR